MEKVKLIETKARQLPEDEEFIWRYFDIHKFLNLIYLTRFKFTRMDQFEDPLEGIPFDILQRYFSMGDKSISLGQYVLDVNPLANGNKIAGRIDKIHQIQSNTFVSCWFSEKRESMAMWNLYSNPDGVAIKIPFGKLKNFLNPEIDKLNLIEYYCGKVSYQDFADKDPYPEDSISRIKRFALRKDISYSHEKEIRFVVKSRKLDRQTIRLNSKPIDLKELEMEVVCHPRMDDWKKTNVKRILRAASLYKCFSESEIKLRF